MEFNRKLISCFSILILLCFLCLLLTLYWSFNVIPLLVFVNSKSSSLPSYSSDLVNDENHHFNNLHDNDDMNLIELEIASRVQRVKQLCKKFHLGKFKWSNNSNDLNLKEPPTALFSYFFWNREKKIGWCPVYKAGSTSWLKNMMRLAGFDEQTIETPPKQLSIWAREVYGELDNLNKEELDKFIKLLVVRHPFERLLSAYRDKLENSSYGMEHGTHHFYLKYGKRIVQKFRTDPTIKQIEPTWEEFIRYILKTDLIQYADDHWLPAYYSCTPCIVDYDFIAKTESYLQDQMFIIMKAGLDKILKPRWSHSTAGKEIQSRLNLRQRYFSQLTKSQIQTLYEKYKLDFLLFDYSHEEYLEYAKDM